MFISKYKTNMANGIKEYKIVINGLQESIDAVTSLNKQLDALEKKINSVSSAKVSAPTGGGSTRTTSNASALSEEERVQKEINKLKEQGAQLDAKIAASQDEVYKRVDATKQLYKETIADQKAIAAQERLTADAYSTNTMVGMKQKLADIKQVMQTTDLGDTDKFSKLTKDANDLNSKLLEIEKSYGQFGRQVGNYAEGVAEGLGKIKITVGDTVREFGSAREASRTLNEELKAMAINGQTDTKEFKELRQVVMELESTMKDVKSPMDAIMDGFQSIAAIASTTKGLSALFGFDDTEIEKSIQKLVALQNVMQGIDTINKQMQTKEGIGGWLAKGNAMIDTFVAKLTGAGKAQKELNAATTAGKTASEGLAAAETAQATATAGATVATKALSFALKTLGIGLIVTAVAYLVENWKDLYNWLTDTIPALKNISSWFDKIKAIVMGVGSAIVNYMVQPLATLIKTIQAIINGNFSEIPKIITEGFKKTFDLAGNYQKGYNKETERQQQAHNRKMLANQQKANDEWLKDEEAKYGQSYERTKQYLNKQMGLINSQLANTKKGTEAYDALIEEQKEVQRKIWENERTEKEKRQKKSETLSKQNAKKDAEIEKELTELQLSAMKEGLNKTLKQLEEERKQRVAKLVANGRSYAQATKDTEQWYNQKVLDATKDWTRKYEKEYKDMWNNIYDYSLESQRKIADLLKQSADISRSEIDQAQSKSFNQNVASYGVVGKYKPVSSDKQESDVRQLVDMQRKTQVLFNVLEALKAKAKYTTDEVAKNVLDNAVKYAQSHLDAALKELDDFKEEISKKYGEIEVEIKFSNLLDDNYSSRLSIIFDQRMSLIERFWTERIAFEKQSAEADYQQQLIIEKEAYDKELREAAQHAEDLERQAKDAYENSAITQAQYNELSERNIAEHADRVATISEQHNNNLVQLEQKKAERIQKINAEAYKARIQELRDFQTAVYNLESKQPVRNAWGITNFKQTNENNKNLLDSYEELSRRIVDIKKDLQTQLNKNEITFDDFQSATRELDQFAQNVGEKMNEVKEKLSLGAQIGEFISDINGYIQTLGQSMQTIFNAVWDYQDYQFDQEQAQLDKWNERLDKALDKQQEIVEQHKDAVNSIEDELATSRGDRRQHLIDQLNAEIAAQREAQAEEKRIQKEKERAQKKQEELDYKRQLAQYENNLTSILLSNAMAAANGYATKPFIPVGLAMGSLAITLGAVQYALAKKAKPQKYAEGGLLVGKSHAEGGIKALGGRVELEGNEYVVNKRTTTQNLDLLEYINSKKRRVDISDLIEFYNGGAVKKNIRSIKTRYADGGYLASLPSDLDIREQLQNIVVNQDNRPIYVSVVDIQNKQNDVRRVQALAGLSD